VGCGEVTPRCFSVDTLTRGALKGLQGEGGGMGSDEIGEGACVRWHTLHLENCVERVLFALPAFVYYRCTMK
jgi:hypothetical protein